MPLDDENRHATAESTHAKLQASPSELANLHLVSLLSTLSHSSFSSHKQELPTLQSLDLIQFYEFFIVFVRYVYVIKHAVGFERTSIVHTTECHAILLNTGKAQKIF